MDKQFIISNEVEMTKVAINLLQDIKHLQNLHVINNMCSNCLSIISLQGELGTGKTTLVRYILRQLGFMGKVKSPTYSFVESYDISLNNKNFTSNFIYQNLHHFDLYRFNNPNSWLEYGFDEYLQIDNLIFIEWSEMAAQYLPSPLLKVNLQILNENNVNKETRLIAWQHKS